MKIKTNKTSELKVGCKVHHSTKVNGKKKCVTIIQHGIMQVAVNVELVKQTILVHFGIVQGNVEKSD